MAASQPEHEHEHEVSGTAGTAPRPAGPVHEHEPPAQRGRHLRGHLGLGRWATAAAVTLVVAALATVLLGRAGLSAGGGGASGSWHTYHDPFGLFTLRVPPGWMAQVTRTTGSFGDRSGGVTERMDQVSFADPAQGTGPGSAFVWVFAIPLQTAVAHQTFCRELNTTLESFSPRNLRSMEPSGVWFFTTETADFQVDVGIPGVVMPARFGLPWPTGTPLPAAWVAADKSAVNAMLVSFRPTDPKPLTC
jgi:hypothetical protein